MATNNIYLFVGVPLTRKRVPAYACPLQTRLDVHLGRLVGAAVRPRAAAAALGQEVERKSRRGRCRSCVHLVEMKTRGRGRGGGGMGHFLVPYVISRALLYCCWKGEQELIIYLEGGIPWTVAP